MTDSILGIVCEYNPFHLGHLHHIQKAKERTGASHVVAVMSGPFTQRGDAALFSPAARAQMALLSGVDSVFEIPALFAVREADWFAMGSVALLTALGCTHISFGCETNDITLLAAAADLLRSPTAAFSDVLRSALNKGHSFARARGEALAAAFSTNIFRLPNNVLALCYLSAIKKINSPLIPVPITRIGGYHDKAHPEKGFFPSATALRGAILRGDWQGLRGMIPDKVYPVIHQEMEHNRIHRPNGLDEALRMKLLDASLSSLARIPGTDEGLDRLLLKNIDSFISKEDLLLKIKSKRYTYTRLNRLLAHLLLNITKDDLPELPHYARLLGMVSDAGPLLSRIKQSGFQLIEKAAAFDRTDASFQTDMRAYDLWSMGAGLPFGMGFRQSPIVVNKSINPQNPFTQR